MRSRIPTALNHNSTRRCKGSNFRRLASVGQEHPGILGSLRFRLRCVRKWTSRSGDRKPPEVVACFAIDRHRILREHRGSVKKGPMMLAAVETVTKADPVWESRGNNSDVAAQATAGKSVHAASPQKSSSRNGYLTYSLPELTGHPESAVVPR